MDEHGSAIWALPALGIAGLGVRDIMGFCMTALIFTTQFFYYWFIFLIEKELKWKMLLLLVQLEHRSAALMVHYLP